MWIWWCNCPPRAERLVERAEVTYVPSAGLLDVLGTEAASQAAGTDMMAKYDYRNPAALKQLVAGGSKLQRFPKDVMDAAFKAAMEVYADLNATNPNWKKIYADYATYRRDANLWFRFTESAFDDFMQQQKL